MNLLKSQKRALFKIAMDLVKIDNQIHGNEILAIEQLQKRFQISLEDIDLAHYMTLEQAINSLLRLSTAERAELIAILRNLISIDNEIDGRENILLSAIQISLDEQYKSYASILSAMDALADRADNQLIYLELRRSPQIRAFLDNPYEFILLNNILAELGLHFFYLPEVIRQLSSQQNGDVSQLEMLCKSLEYMVPSGSKTDLEQIRTSVEHLDITTFSQFVCTHYHVHPTSQACLLIAVQDENVLDDDSQSHRCTDYLCLDVTQDIKQRLLTFIQILNHTHFSISYHGYYKALFNFLSSERKINSSILITPKRDWALIDCNNKILTFTSAPQAKSLYLLLIKYGLSGINHSLWSEAANIITEMAKIAWTQDEEMKKWLLDRHSDSANLVYNMLTIYQFFSNRDIPCLRMIEYLQSIIAHKSSLKNYINNAISEVVELANKEQYQVCYNAETRSYYTLLEAKMVYIATSTENTSLCNSALWKSLI